MLQHLLKRALGPIALLAALVAGCGGEARQPLDAFFVRHGLAVLNSGQAPLSLRKAGREVVAFRPGRKNPAVTQLSGGRLLLDLPWRPGESFELSAGGKILKLTAPQHSTPLLVAAIGLEEINPHGGQMGHAPDTQLRFSHRGDRLAIGTMKGRLLLVEVPSGRRLWARKIAEGMVKRLAWGRLKGRRVLYVGEQSPEGLVYCLDAEDGREIWRFDTSRQVGRGSVTSDNKHAVYNLPGIYYLRVLPGGDILVAATHGRFVGQEFRHDCRVWRLDGAKGSVAWRWPAGENFPFGITWIGASEDGQTLAFISFNTFGKQAAGVYKEGALYCLAGDSGKARWLYQVPALRPHYNRVGSWHGVSVSPDGRRVLLGLNDGRVMLFDGRRGGRGPLWTLPLGAPVMVGELPVAAPVSYARLGGRAVFLATPGTSIPSGSRAGGRTPQPHPHARHFFAFDLSGRLKWQHKTEGSAQGIALSRDGSLVATCVGASQESDDRDRFGLTLFKTNPGRGESPLVYHFASQGPAFFQADISDDGRYLALTESPYSRDEGKTVCGSYRVLVIH